MKKHGVCPKCASQGIATIKSEFGTRNKIMIELLTFADVTRYICTSCGYMEQYIEDEKALEKLRSHAGSDTTL